MYASTKNQESYAWWAGNARFIDLSNTFVVAHIAQAALIMLWAGTFTLFELSVYSASKPLYGQGLILLPHLATQGWGLGPGGDIADTYIWFAIGVIHIVSAIVLLGGAYFHRSKLPASLDMAVGKASKFHFEWRNPQQLGMILGHHLIILGLGALLVVAKAQFFGGLYDANLGEVRLVVSPTLDPGTIWDYRNHFYHVNSLEDLVGGHIYVAVMLIIGGVWHILVSPFEWVEQLFCFSGDGILSYSLFGIAFAGYVAAFYSASDSLAYPEVFYGPVLELKWGILPRYLETHPSSALGYTTRMWLANSHLYLAFFFLQGGLWHYQRAMGFGISRLAETWRENLLVSSENPVLSYQAVEMSKSPSPLLLDYGLPQTDPIAFLRWEQPFEDYSYSPPSQGIETPGLTAISGIEKKLYQIRYRTQRETFYQPSKGSGEKLFDDGRQNSIGLYERPRAVAQASHFVEPISEIVYKPKCSSDS